MIGVIRLVSKGVCMYVVVYVNKALLPTFHTSTWRHTNMGSSCMCGLTSGSSGRSTNFSPSRMLLVMT